MDDRKCPNMTKKLLTGMSASKQTNKLKKTEQMAFVVNGGKGLKAGKGLKMKEDNKSSIWTRLATV